MKKTMLCMTFLIILTSAAVFAQDSFTPFVSYEDGKKNVIGFQIYGEDMDKALIKTSETGKPIELTKIREKELQSFSGGQSVFQIEFEEVDKKGKYIIICQGAVIDELLHLRYADKEVTLFKPETEE